MVARALRRRTRLEIRQRSQQISQALDLHAIPRDGSTAASLIALGIEMAEDLKHPPDALLRLCQQIVEAPRVAGPEGDTWGT